VEVETAQTPRHRHRQTDTDHSSQSSHRAELHGRAYRSPLLYMKIYNKEKLFHESSSIKALPVSKGKFTSKNSLPVAAGTCRYTSYKHMPQIDMLPRPGAARLPAWAERVGNGQVGRLDKKGLLKPFRLPCR
jgi:hypothetical protein